MELDQIKQFFPVELRTKEKELLREYLQYEILKLVFEGKYAHRYTFLGGTCLRIGYNSNRFSEDLDFDNVDLTQAEFEDTAARIKRGLELIGFEVEISFTYKGAFHCKVRFPSLLYKFDISPHKEAKLLVKLDTEKQHYEYERALIPISKCGVQTDILAVPLSLLGSQKIAAIMGRKRAKGRDYFDLYFILQQTGLDYRYLEDRFKVSDADELRSMVSNHIAELDFDQLAEDVKPFLFEVKDVEVVRNFQAYWESVEL